MMTFKQLEALYWVVKLGGYHPAALKLHTAQSAVSKRIQELESQLGVELFDRTERSSRLTEKGDELVRYAQQLLELRDEAASKVCDSSSISRTVRLGVTELTAMTWLPRFTAAIQERYPRVVVEPDVDASLNLREKMLADEVDLVIIPEAYNEPRFVSELVGETHNLWMCKPGLIDTDRPLALKDLSDQPLLANRSGPGLIYDRWFKSVGFVPVKRLTSNSIVALVSFAVSGLGITYLPASAFQHLVQAGFLTILDVSPPLPPIRYVAMYKTNRGSELISSLVHLAQGCCDFSNKLQTIPTWDRS
ncbi:LysR family transcriptional regulator [Paraburkholderia sediminicola]|uniref:LysR family transcriptional regulator n=1 Tax=Paraburkholderia sediminicola TaxID=458836 RepID=UPI0038B93F53